MRRAFTLLELLLVISITGLTMLVMLRQLHLTLDRIETRNAVRAAGTLVARAREEALLQQKLTTVRIDTLAGTLDLSTRYGRVTMTSLASAHGVRISTTRDSISFDVRGLGFGTANLTLVARRGAAADTLTVSRLGRVRY